MIIDEKMIMKRCHNLTYDYRNVDVKKKKKGKVKPIANLWYL